MSNDNATQAVESLLEAMRAEIEALSKRVTELESMLEHEHEDLVRLKEVADEDHRRLQTLKEAALPGPPPPTVTPVGL